MAAVCQPEAAKPLNNVSRAAASSRCIGCGSNSAAKRLMSSSLTLSAPLLNFMPSVKASNHSIIHESSGVRIRLAIVGHEGLCDVRHPFIGHSSLVVARSSGHTDLY